MFSNCSCPGYLLYQSPQWTLSTEDTEKVSACFALKGGFVKCKKRQLVLNSATGVNGRERDRELDRSYTKTLKTCFLGGSSPKQHDC